MDDVYFFWDRHLGWVWCDQEHVDDVEDDTWSFGFVGNWSFEEAVNDWRSRREQVLSSS